MVRPLTKPTRMEVQMSDTPIEEMKVESASSGKDPKTRAILIALVVLWLVTLAALVGFAFKS